jgi:hypothetical protein
MHKSSSRPTLFANSLFLNPPPKKPEPKPPATAKDAFKGSLWTTYYAGRQMK